MKGIEIMKRIAKMGMTVFTVSEFRRATDLSETAAQKLLERYTKRGLLTRLKKGMYIVTDKPPTSFLIFTNGCKMISLETINEFALKNQTTELNTAREYLQNLFLSYFYQQDRSEAILFKDQCPS